MAERKSSKHGAQGFPVAVLNPQNNGNLDEKVVVSSSKGDTACNDGEGMTTGISPRSTNQKG